MKTYVTGRRDFMDIDTLASAIAYRDLLELRGIDAEALLPYPNNPSVTQEIMSWKMDYCKDQSVIIGGDKFVLVDSSEHQEIAQFVPIAAISEVFDHYGEAEYWKAYPRVKTTIQDVGACATLIWEEYVKSSKQYKVARVTADLIRVAISSQTMNFHSSVTTKRDLEAFNYLKQYSGLDDKWFIEYFKNVDDTRVSNLEFSLKNDSKLQEVMGKPCVIVQQELWDSKSVIEKNIAVIKKVMNFFRVEYPLFNSPSLMEGRNYIIVDNVDLIGILEKCIDAEFTPMDSKYFLGKTKKLWLRKEILKKIAGMRK